MIYTISFIYIFGYVLNLVNTSSCRGSSPYRVGPLFGSLSCRISLSFYPLYFLPLSIAFRSSLRSTPFLNPFLSVCCPSGTGVLNLLAYRQFPISRPTFIPMFMCLYFIIYVFIQKNNNRDHIINLYYYVYVIIINYKHQR
ncbi:hypothetical protein D1872_38110 [compost metagenome]